MKTTKGPFTAYKGKLREQFPTIIREVKGADGKTVISWGGFDGVDRPDDEMDGNLALFAAAPELLATCRKVAAWLRRLQKQAEAQASTSMRFPSLKAATEADAKNYAKTAADIEAVIAKAAGVG